MKRLIICLIVPALVACGSKTDDQAKSAGARLKPPAQQAAMQQTLPPGHPSVTPGGAVAEASVPQANPAKLTGKVIETIDSAGYTYIKLRTDSGDVWAAVPQTTARRGTVITILPQMTMEKFESKTLKRRFDHIIFGMVDSGQRAPLQTPMAMASAVGEAAQHMASPDAGDVKVARAEGADARTVAELWAARTALKDSPVTIRGKVVKFLPGIMGRNWLHLRDGSGARASGDNDVTVTTADSVAVGDIVLVHGTVHIDKDFGAGYRYPVIVEEASVTK